MPEPTTARHQAVHGQVQPRVRRRVCDAGLKRQITIRLDEDTLEYFKRLAEEAEVPYQT